jgi:hypothetical protein
MKCGTKTLEVAVGIIALGWGMLLLAPWDTFSQGPAYTVMARSGIPENAWGCLFFISGAGQLLALWRNSVTGRRVLSIVGGAIWMFTAAMYLLSNYQLTHWVGPVVFSFSEYLAAVQLPSRR